MNFYYPVYHIQKVTLRSGVVHRASYSKSNPGIFFQGIRRPRILADHSPTSHASIKKSEWNYMSLSRVHE